MITLGKTQVLACRGELDWLCRCEPGKPPLSPERIQQLINWFSGMSQAEIADRYTLICCAVKARATTQPGQPGGAAAADACARNLLDKLCSTEGKARITAARIAVAAMRAVISADPRAFPITRAALALVAAALDAIDVACSKGQLSHEAARMVCGAALGAAKLGTEGVLSSVLSKPVDLLFGEPNIAAAIRSCCQNEIIAQADIPDWMVV